MKYSGNKMSMKQLQSFEDVFMSRVIGLALIVFVLRGLYLESLFTVKVWMRMAFTYSYTCEDMVILLASESVHLMAGRQM